MNGRNMIRVNIPIRGMSCAACAQTIEKGLKETAGIASGHVNLATESAVVEYDPEKVDLVQVRSVINGSGYDVASRKSVFPVSGMTCASCVSRVENALSTIPGVISTTINLASEKVSVEYLDSVTFSDLRQAVRDAGYDLLPESHAVWSTGPDTGIEIKQMKIHLIFAAVVAVVVMGLGFITSTYGSSISYLQWALATPVQFWAGWRFYRGIWKALKHRTADMNTLIAVVTSAAYE